MSLPIHVIDTSGHASVALQTAVQGVLVNFAPSRAPVAQWMEQRFPKPQVVLSIRTGGISTVKLLRHWGVNLHCWP
jgi:hypothetical protein